MFLAGNVPENRNSERHVIFNKTFSRGTKNTLIKILVGFGLTQILSKYCSFGNRFTSKDLFFLRFFF